MRNLTVIVPSKTDANLRACAEALCEHDPDINFVFVDDGLTCSPWAASIANVIEGEKPFIFARNINAGIRAVPHDDVILLNDDALLESPGGFTAMQMAAESHPEYGVISAATNVSNNPAQQARGIGLRDAGNAVAFVCVLIPRRTIELVGLLDERFTGSIDGEMIYGGEDTDYCYRTRKAGLKIGVFDGCFVDHSKLKSTFRPHGGGLPINATMKRFREIHGVQMETR
jgi:Glycosyl transferase family 2